MNSAWVVAVATDDMVDKAVNSGHNLRQTNSQHPILAVVSSKISKSCISKLETIFDLVILKDVDLITNRLSTPSGAHFDEIDSLLIAALSMTTFSKLVVVRPGFLMLPKSDKLFEGNNVVMLNKSGNWEAVIISPDKDKHAQILTKITSNGLIRLSRPSDILNLIFSGKWTRTTETETFTEESYDSNNDWVAIVGMACRFPNANSSQEYWDLLASGQTTSSSPPTHRKNLVDMNLKIKGNFLKCPIDQFDASFFGLSPSEAIFTDPQARLLLEVSWEALENAAINPEQLKGSKTGVFYGSWLQDYRDAMNAEESNSDFIRKYIGNSFGCSAAKLSFFYGFTGPNISTESGCSSSMVAVDLALKSLQKGECPVAMVAGANVLLYMGMKQKVLWAEDGMSRTFDAKANGYARAEGVAVLILKRYCDARRDGDRIHAVITGSGVSQEGLSKSFGTPTVESECQAMRTAMTKAKVKPWEVDYVEAHATGTAVGDPIEAQAIVKAYSATSECRNLRDKPLYIGSGKTNIGHTESCSGMAGIFKVVLALQNELIPAHVNLNTINPQVNFDSIPGVIPVESVPWPKKKNGKRIGGVSSFGITGTDVHLIIQEAPEVKLSKLKQEAAASPAPHILTISAKTESALEEFAKLYENYLEHSTAPLENITYTANICRPHHPFRMAVLGRSKPEMLSNLFTGMCSRGKTATPKICFTFPGRIGLMDLEPARILYNTSPVFRNTMDQCNQLFQQTTGNSLITLLTNPEEDTVAKGVPWYALILGIQYSLVKLWESWGINPDCVMGHCIGEISAGVVSGALPLPEVFKLVTCIQYFLQVGKEKPALMMAIQAPAENVEEMINLFMQNNCWDTSGTWIDVASCNAFDQTVIAGDTKSIGQFKSFLSSQSYRCKVLVMDFCAHSRAVEPACQQSLPIFQQIVHRKMEIPYVSSVTGKVVRDQDLDGHYWYRVFRNCVNFTKSCRTVSTEGLADVYIEMGLEGALSRLTQENLKVLKTLPPNHTEVCLPSLWKLKGDKCWLGLGASLAQIYALGGNVNWEGFYNFGENKPERVELPHYPFQRKSFWFERKRNRAEIDFKGVLNQREIVHPLLGAHVETCVENVSIFENRIGDNCPEIKYLFDHVIGTEVIFPGAGFLEVIVAAVAKVERTSCVKMENFKVSSPLHLERGGFKRVQCRLDKKEKTGSVYSCGKDSEGGSVWKLHASGIYKVEEPAEPELESIDKLAEIMERVKEKQGASQQFYMSAEKVGLEFGPDFRSMQRVFQNDNKEETLIELTSQNEEVEGYVCHPILIDAMFQALILHGKPELQRLHVPVKIGTFSVHRVTSPVDKFYVYCKGTEDVHLLDSSGKVVASMKTPELVATSVESVLKAAGYQTTKQTEEPAEENAPVTLDQFLVTWQKSRWHQTGSSIQLECSQQSGSSQLFNALESIFEQRNIFSEEEQDLDNNMTRLCCLYVLKALFELDCVPNDIEDLRSHVPEKLGIVPGLVPAFTHFLSYIENDLLAEFEGSFEKLNTQISELLEKLGSYPALETVQSCGSQLAGILRGTVNPYGILFGGTGDNLAERYYKNTRFAFRKCLKEVFTIIHEQVQRAKTAGGDTIRILEVGGGSGGFASGVVDYFTEFPEKYEYTFTDISPSFVSKAKERFSRAPCFIFKVANVEQDLLQQGLSPEYFDIVVAVDVLHATRNVKAALRNLEMVTKPGGFIILKETEKPVKEVDICFGILEGYWLFEDVVRENHCTLKGSQWLELLKKHGFAQSQSKFLACSSQMSVITAQKEKRDNISLEMAPVDGNRKWLVVSIGSSGVMKSCMANKMKALGRQVEFVNFGDHNNSLETCLENGVEGIIVLFNDQFSVENAPNPRSVLEPLLSLGKCLGQIKGKLLPKFHLVTFDCANNVEPEVSTIGNLDASLGWGFVRNLRIELPGIHCKTVDLEKDTDEETTTKQILGELWLDDKETEVAFRGDTRYIRRTLYQKVPVSDKADDLGVNGRFYQVELPKSKMISEVTFVEMEEPRELAPDEILVEVKSVSLNFKDVLAVMKPSPDFEQLTSLGLDFAGVVSRTGSQLQGKWAVGQPVFGCGWEQGAMKSYVIAKENGVIPVPQYMTFQEAATLPAVWITAWYCIVIVAKLQKGQTILVHAASGGVGLIAIQIANMLGANIIGTAGTEKKRDYLRRLDIRHVFNSRTTDFAQEIQEVTNGQGVDMVLNCLTGPGFKEASLQVCKDGGHFVEISKLDIWTTAQVTAIRPKVNYTVVDATQVDKDLLRDILAKLGEFLDQGQIKPLPYTQFPATDLTGALVYLQKAKQIGKVIVTMPQWEQVGPESYRLKHYLFHDKSSYLITGGKGAIGMSVAKWMVTQGAKYLILAGRSPPAESVKQEFEVLEQNYGAVVVCREVDISDFESCKRLVQEFGNGATGDIPPLRGVHHCAGALSDKLLGQHQNWSSYEIALPSKVQGAWNLHQLTKDMNLEFFVLYSSAASTFGNIGQSNYCAANCYLDSLASLRVAMGLPGLAINWGQWNMGIAKDISVDWLHPFTAEEGTVTLERLMMKTAKNPPCVVAGLFDLHGLLRMTPYYKDTFLETVDLDEASFLGRGASKSETKAKSCEETKGILLISQFQSAEDENARTDVVKNFVIRVLCETLGTKPEEVQDYDQHFSEMGMDSLMSIEFANKLNSEMEDGSAGVLDLEECGTINKLSAVLHENLAKSLL